MYIWNTKRLMYIDLFKELNMLRSIIDDQNFISKSIKQQKKNHVQFKVCQ